MDLIAIGVAAANGGSGGGTSGKDGYSPTVSVTEIDNGHKVNITDTNGTKSFDVLNGEKGDKGDKGDTGSDGKDGSNGKDGYTPVKGTDYWTEDDKSAIVNEVAAQTYLKSTIDSKFKIANDDISANTEAIKQNKTDILSVSKKVTTLENNVGGHTVKADVPANAKFTDTVYDDSEIKERLADLENAPPPVTQITPEFAESVEWLEENGDTSKVYVLPDGYIYGYKNGVWENTVVPFVVEERLEKTIEACCDTETISGENYNLLKASECFYKSKLQNDSTEIASSTNYNFVTNVIPVEYGKYYTISREVNGERVTYGSNENSGLLSRINVHLNDGTVLPNQVASLKVTPVNTSAFYINSENIVAVQVQIYLEPDVSTAERVKNNKIMITAGDTLEASREKALRDYIDGDAEMTPEVVYTLKHDNTKANQSELNEVKKAIENIRPIENLSYNNAYIYNDRFIRSISNLRDDTKAKEFTITIGNNSGKVIKNAAIAIGLHNTVGVIPENNNLPFQVYDDTFSEPTGFKFFDDNGKELPYYIESESACNYITDKRIKTDQKTMGVFSDGKIVVYNDTVKRVQMSADDGVTWANICSNITDIPYRILLPDSQGNLFVASTDGYRLYKYTSADGYMTGTQVIDMESYGTKIGSTLAEDSDGNLYLGTYQSPTWRCTIRKSTDHGNTWTVVFDTTDCEHVHNLFINTKSTPNEIFIGLDGTAADVRCYVSKDAGNTWEQLNVPYNNRDYAFRYAGENFYIGGGERLYFGGATLYKTNDYNDVKSYYPLFDNGQGIRDITNVIEGSDDVLICGGCVGQPVSTEQLFLSEDRGETWKTVLIRPYHRKQNIAGKGLRTFSKKGNEIMSETSSSYAMRFVYGNGAKTILAVVAVGDIPTTGKTITVKTGYVANIEQMDKVLTLYENIDGKVADIRIRDGYVLDAVSNKRIVTDETEIQNYNIKLGQTSEYKILENHAYRLNGTVNLGKLSRLNFTRGFTVSMLFRKSYDTLDEYWSDNKKHIIFQTGETKLVLRQRTLKLMHGETDIYTTKLSLDDAYLMSVSEDYVRVTFYVTSDSLPKANIYTDNKWKDNDIECTEYPITQNFSENNFIVGNSLGSDYGEMPNIARIEIYNRVLSHGEIMSLTNGCNLVTDNSQYN